MATLRNAADRKKLIERICKLSPDSRAQWGSFTVERMICHLSDGLANGLGDVTMKSVNMKMFQKFPVKHLVFLLPLPKGSRTVPEMLATSPGDFAVDRERVLRQIERLAAKPAGAGPEHPFFGWLTNQEWQLLQYKHIDHHLRQFGC